MKPHLQRLIDPTGMGRAGRRGRVPAVLMCVVLYAGAQF